MKPISNDEWDKKAKKWVLVLRARMDCRLFDEEMLKNSCNRKYPDNDISKCGKAITDAITEHKFPHDVCWIPIIKGHEKGKYRICQNNIDRMLEIARRYRAKK